MKDYNSAKMNLGGTREVDHETPIGNLPFVIEEVFQDMAGCHQ